MTDPDITARVDQVMAEAAALPSAEEVRDLAARAIAHGGTRTMSLAQAREIADKAVAGAEEVAALMRRLSELLADPDSEPGTAPGTTGAGSE